MSRRLSWYEYVIDWLGFMIPFAIFFGVVAAIAYLCYRPYKHRLLSNGGLSLERSKRINRIWIATPFVLAFFVTWYNLHPPDAYYKRQFEAHFGLQLPESADFVDTIYHTPGFQDGDSFEAIVTLDEKDYILLSSEMETNDQFDIADNHRDLIHLTGNCDSESPYCQSNLQWIYTTKRYGNIQIGFFKDGKSVCFGRWSI
ncbi:MAG: hypothetical protein RLZZ262_1719 [Bacteroidota bacterium]